MILKYNRFIFLILFYFCVVFFSNCTETEYSIPHKQIVTKSTDFNKDIFKFNESFYRYSIYPVYNFSSNYLPMEFLWLFKISGKNYFDTPSDIVLSLLELDFESFLISFWRFTLNSTFGIFGFFDIASNFGLDSCDKSLDMVLERYGIPEGEYIILPIIGPAVYRSMFNDIFRFSVSFAFLGFTFGFFGPLYFGQLFTFGIPTLPIFISSYTLGSLYYIGFNFWKLEQEKNSAFNFYSALKNSYLQRNRANIANNIRLRNSGRLKDDNFFINNIFLFKDEDDFVEENEEDYLYEMEFCDERFKPSLKFN